MCGRFTLTLEVSALQMAFNLGAQTVSWKANYNLAPSMDIPVLTNQKPAEIQCYRWGLIPAWAKNPSIGSTLINARSETIQEKPSFRTAFQSRRCLILTDGFYEWKKAGSERSTRMPYYFHRPDRSPFFFAGLWDIWRGAADHSPLFTCTIITCPPNEIISTIHDRMPVILDESEGTSWLKTGQNQDFYLSLLKPKEDDFLTLYPVSTLVNSPAHNSPDCIRPIDLLAQL